MNSLHGIVRQLVLVLVLIYAPSLGLAQGVTTAAASGLITDQNGQPLAGANLIATHQPSGTIYGTSSRGDGSYTLPGLRVGGPYSLMASLIGYKKQTMNDIYLQLSETRTLNFSLPEEAVQAEEVVVVGERTSLFNPSRTGATTNVSRENIDRLPSLTRNFQDYYKLSPYFNPATATGASGNALGRNSKYNNIQIDGTNFNDLFGLGSTGAPAGQATTKIVTAISLDAIEEFQLVVSPFDVRHSDFTGAGINAITRAGTNHYAGSVFYYGRNEDFAGNTPTGVTPLRKKLDGFSDYQVGGRVGGPIIEDQLFFFANAELTRFKQPFSRTFGNVSFGTNAFTANADSLRILSDTLKSRYGYDPGGFETITPVSESEKLFLRFDYNLSESHKLTARWNYLHAVDDNSPSRGRGATDIYFENGRYKLQNKTHSFALQVTSLFGNSASNEFILGYNDQFDNPTFYGQPFPTLYIATTGGIPTQSQNLILGSEEFRHYNELGQKVFEITNNFSWYLTDHTITLGAKANLFSFRNLFIPDGFGQYAYSSIARFLQNLSPDGAPGFSAYTYRYSATADPLQEANWKGNQYGFYAQDEWTVNPRLKLIAGARVDIPRYSTSPNYNAALDSTFFAFSGVHYRTDEPPKTSLAFSPRLGFNWAVDEERNTQVRGGVGIFYGRFPFVWVSNQYSNTGVDFYTRGRIVGTDTVRQFVPDPYNQPKPASSVLPSAEVDLTDRDFKAPSVFRWNLAADHKLPFLDLVATVEAIFSTTQNDVFTQNINLKGVQNNDTTSTGAARAGGALTPGGRIVGENREVWGRLRDSTTYTVQWVNAAQFSPGVFLVRNTNLGSNANIILQVQRNVPEGLNGSVAYTWGLAKDINSNNSTTASSQWRFNPTQGNPNEPKLTYSQWDRRHRILATLSYRHEWSLGLATTIGLFYNGQSGRPFSYMVQGDVNGDGRSDNDLVYIPGDKNDIILVNTAGAVLPKTNADYQALFDFIDRDDYLKEHKGQMSERSGPREPWSSVIDLRIAQEIPTFAGHKLEITLDILNVMNLLDGGAGWVRNTGLNQTVNLMQFVSFETAGDPTTNPNYGKPRYRWLGVTDPFQPDNILSRWQMQLGIRYTI